MDRIETELPQSLYDQDLYAWTQAQAAAIRRTGAEWPGAIVDWENVAEELDALGRSELDAVNSHIATVIEHLLKLCRSPAREPRADWRGTVRKARAHLDDKLSPSLRRKVELNFDKLYRRGRSFAADGLARDGIKLADLPETCPWTLDQLLDEDYWPEGATEL